MAKLINSAIMSLDGYIADEHGIFDWAEPDEQVHAFINKLERLVGRRRGGWIDPTDRGRAHVSRGLVSISGHRGDASPRASALHGSSLRKYIHHTMSNSSIRERAGSMAGSAYQVARFSGRVRSMTR